MYTQEQIDNRTSDYVCSDCGKQFLTEGQLKTYLVTTVHSGDCGLCNKEASLIHIRHYNYLRLKQPPTTTKDIQF